MGPQIALAASARDWPDSLHRFLMDHGGGRVRSRVMGPEQAIADDFDVILIDDICSFLTPRLIARLRESGKEVIGVFSPEDGPDAKRRLLECGITDVIESDASPEEFLTLTSATLAHRSQPPTSDSRSVEACVIGVTGIAGSGVTEVAIGLARDLAWREPSVLVDLNLDQPAIAQRLDLPLHPNLLTAVDLAHHDQARLGEAVQQKEELNVLVGLPPSRAGSGSLPNRDVLALVQDLSTGPFSSVVADLGSDHLSLPTKVLDVVIVVGLASPVGLTRLIRLVDSTPPPDRAEVLAVVNRAPGGSRRADEMRVELASALGARPMMMLREDRRVGSASWDGGFVDRGHFEKSISRLGRLIQKTVLT